MTGRATPGQELQDLAAGDLEQGTNDAVGPAALETCQPGEAGPALARQ